MRHMTIRAIGGTALAATVLMAVALVGAPAGVAAAHTRYRGADRANQTPTYGDYWGWDYSRSDGPDRVFALTVQPPSRAGTDSPGVVTNLFVYTPNGTWAPCPDAPLNGFDGRGYAFDAHCDADHAEVTGVVYPSDSTAGIQGVENVSDGSHVPFTMHPLVTRLPGDVYVGYVQSARSSGTKHPVWVTRTGATTGMHVDSWNDCTPGLGGSYRCGDPSTGTYHVMAVDHGSDPDHYDFKTKPLDLDPWAGSAQLWNRGTG